MRRGTIVVASVIAAALIGSVAAWGYFSATKTSPQPISVANLAPPPADIRLETSSSIADNREQLLVPAPAGVLEGWLMIATAGTRGDTVFTPPAGWTPLLTTNSPTSQITMRSWWHVAGPSEPTSYLFVNKPKKETDFGIVAYSGVRAANPIDDVVGASGNSATATAPTANADFKPGADAAPDAKTHRLVAVGFNAKDALTWAGATQVWQTGGGGGRGSAADAVQSRGPTDPTSVTGKAAEWAIQTIVINGSPG